jgi:NTE family protein
VADLESAEDQGPVIGLCLSGGGFRAALYGLGVTRYLAEAGLLRRVAVICGVSGGSVATAALGSAVESAGPEALSGEGFIANVFDPFLAAVAETDIRNTALRRWLLGRLRLGGEPRNLVLGEVLAEQLFPALDRLAGLPASPQLIFTATELAAGRAFRFSRDFIGSWDFGYAPPPSPLRVSTAVAASAAAPPFIPPFQLETAATALEGAPPRLAVTDGGVYDNLGVEWFQGFTPQRRPDGAVAVQDLIVVNASGPLGRNDRPIRGLRALNRMRKVQYAQTQATRVRWLVSDLEAGRRSGLYLGIVGDPRRYRLPSGQPVDPDFYVGALPSRLVAPLAGLRTDFNRFSVTEAGLLAYHGYWSAHARFASLRPAEALARPAWREFAEVADADAARLERELRSRRRRLGIGERTR